MPLSLSRFPGEAIAIGPGITVEVVAVDRFGKVRLRIAAPDDVLILRTELIGRSVVLPPRVAIRQVPPAKAGGL